VADPFEPPERDPVADGTYWPEFGLGMVTWLVAALSIGLLVGGMAVAVPMLSPLALFGGLGIGLAQVVFVGPLVAWFMREGRTARATGVLFAAGLAFGFNALCWGTLAVSLAQGGRLAG
jgi:hypothetical protein